MQRGHGLAGDLLEEGKMHQVDVEVQDVELVTPLAQFVQHRRWAARSDLSVAASSRMAWSRTGTSVALVRASALANSVTS